MKSIGRERGRLRRMVRFDGGRLEGMRGTYPPEPAPSKLRNVDVKLDHGYRKNLSNSR